MKVQSFKQVRDDIKRLVEMYGAGPYNETQKRILKNRAATMCKAVHRSNGKDIEFVASFSDIVQLNEGLKVIYVGFDRKLYIATPEQARANRALVESLNSAFAEAVSSFTPAIRELFY
jgi:hypothetical protein